MSALAGLDVKGDQYLFSDPVGDIGRNTYRGDPSYTTDVRVQRVFNLTERVKAEASAEAFNLFSRQNVNAIDTVYGAPAFLGPIPQKFGDGVSSPANPTFGTPSFVAPARQIQLPCGLVSSPRFVDKIMPIPTEPIGSIPRTPELLAAMSARARGEISSGQILAAEQAALRDTVALFRPLVF